MRKAEPEKGATRTRRRFLWLSSLLPWKVGEKRQIRRWWEWAKVVQELQLKVYKYHKYLAWTDIAWGDLSEQDVEAVLWEVDFED